MKNHSDETIHATPQTAPMQGRFERLGLHARWYSMVLTPTLLIVLASRGEDTPWGLLALLPWSQFWLLDAISERRQGSSKASLWRTMIRLTVLPWHLGLLILILASSL